MTLQFAVHFSSLIFLYSKARTLQATFDAENNSTSPITDTIDDVKNTTLTDKPELDSLSNLHTEFKASIVNSTVYIIWMSVQIATFVVNYKGHPFMQDLRNNKPLCYSFIGSMFVVFICVNGWSPSLTEQLSIVDFPNEFRPILLGVIIIDFVMAYLIDRICEYLFGRLKLDPL